jgi:hypothetical protein
LDRCWEDQNASGPRPDNTERQDGQTPHRD